MKLLILLRHAKSDWGTEELADFDRPLNERGKQDAPRMARYLKDSRIIPQRIVSSPARRARKTASFMAQGIAGDDSVLSFVSNIYAASVDTLLDVIRDFDNDIECYMLVGHNPGLTLLANHLIKNPDQHLDNIPTTGVVVLQLNVSDWHSIDASQAELAEFITPADVVA